MAPFAYRSSFPVAADFSRFCAAAASAFAELSFVRCAWRNSSALLHRCILFARFRRIAAPEKRLRKARALLPLRHNPTSSEEKAFATAATRRFAARGGLGVRRQSRQRRVKCLQQQQP